MLKKVNMLVIILLLITTITAAENKKNNEVFTLKTTQSISLDDRYSNSMYVKYCGLNRIGSVNMAFFSLSNISCSAVPIDYSIDMDKTGQVIYFYGYYLEIKDISSNWIVFSIKAKEKE